MIEFKCILRRLVNSGSVVVAAAGNDVEIALTLTSDAKVSFLLSSFPQVFGVYVIGPWGVIQPDATKIRPENWMHGEHSAAREIEVSPDAPYKTTMKLSDWFDIKNAKQFCAGKYVIVVKFYDGGLMKQPVSSNTLELTLK